MLHIALCDDNPASIEILEKYFDILNDSTIDYDVYFSAEELYRYKLNNELTYDIYILDIEMQGMNGLELAKTIRTNEPNALIIFLTSYSEYVFEYSCAMKSHFRKFGNQMSGSGNHLCNYASLLA